MDSTGKDKMKYHIRDFSKVSKYFTDTKFSSARSDAFLFDSIRAANERRKSIKEHTFVTDMNGTAYSGF